MGVTDRMWGAFTAMIKLEDKVSRQNEAIKHQQQKIENLTERVIRLEAMLEIAIATRRASVPQPPQLIKK
jgi:uncharacterized protein (UPF0210 family)